MQKDAVRTRNQINVPKPELPKGGGATRSRAPDMQADAFTGAATLQLPLDLPPARALTPELVVNYHSAMGNGLLGFGAALAESSISIKTDNGVPKYDGSDIFLLDGSVELVEQAGGVYLERRQSLFSHIEKCNDGGHCYWKVVHGDNTTAIYGKTRTECIADPDHPQRIYKWLLSEQYDADGNIVRYHYHRFGGAGANTYLTSIEYGNYFDERGQTRYAFMVLLDYGQVHQQRLLGEGVVDTMQAPAPRPDILHSYRSGFHVTTRYLLRNVWIFHAFRELGPQPCLVGRTAFSYHEAAVLSHLRQVSQFAYTRTAVGTGGYTETGMPSVDFHFTEFIPQPSPAYATLSATGDGLNFPLHFLDADHSGIPGLLYRNAGTLLYYPPLGGGRYHAPRALTNVPSGFADARQPMRIVSLEGNGELQLEASGGTAGGYYSMAGPNAWAPFTAFPSQALNDIAPRTEYAALSGGGRMDAVVFDITELLYTPSLGLGGMGERRRLPNDGGVEPAAIASPLVHHGFADMFGDGLAHRVKIEDRKITIWPSLGYGKFGQAIIIDHIAGLDVLADQIDLRSRLVLADVNGNGCADVVLVYTDRVRVLFNHGGRGFSPPMEFKLPDGVPYAQGDTIQFADINGDGAPCMVFSKMGSRIVHYYARLGNGHAHLLCAIDGNQGAETRITYKSSAQDYLAAQQAGTPWSTQPYHAATVVAAIVSHDHIAQTALCSEYTYRDGCYDSAEGKFTGFGCVHRLERDSAAPGLAAMPAVLHKQWFHLGAAAGAETGLGREARQALAGSLLRHEVYDAADMSCPYQSHGYHYTVLQAAAPAFGKRGVYRTFCNETISTDYQRQIGDPRISQYCVLEVDDYNHPLLSCTLHYPRRQPLIPEQARMLCTVEQTACHNQRRPGAVWLGIVLQERTFELSGLSPRGQAGNQLLPWSELKTLVASALPSAQPYSAQPALDGIALRLLSWTRHRYWADAAQSRAWDGAGDLPAVLLPRHQESAEFDVGTLRQAFGDRLEPNAATDAGYVFQEGYWWNRGAVLHYDAQAFHLPVRVAYDWVADTGHDLYTESEVSYDAYALFPIAQSQRLDAGMRLTTRVEFDYRVLQPRRSIDANGVCTEVAFDERGHVIATALYDSKTDAGNLPLRHFRRQRVADLDDLFSRPLHYIQQAGTFFHYEFARREADGGWRPGCSVVLARTRHRGDDPGEVGRVIEHFDGAGRTIESRQWTGLAPSATQGPWRVSDRTDQTAGGLPVRLYPPYFSSSWRCGHADQTAARQATRMAYDALGRTVRIDQPWGVFSKVVYLNAWEQLAFDACDTLAESRYYLEGNWRNNEDEQLAVQASLPFYGTPALTVADPMGRIVLNVEDNSTTPSHSASRTARLEPTDIDAARPELLVSWLAHDIQGRVIREADPRFHQRNLEKKVQQYNTEHCYAISGQALRAVNCDTGPYCALRDVHGNVALAWDPMGNRQRHRYDALRRHVSTEATQPGGTAHTILRIEYGEGHAAASAHNLHGRVWKIYDEGGLLTTPGYTFDGHPQEQQRQFRHEFRHEADWSETNVNAAQGLLETEVYRHTPQHDALARPLASTLPDGTVLRWRYGPMGHCIHSSIDVQGQGAPMDIVAACDINAHGDPTAIRYGNGVQAAFAYDPQTLRMTRRTARQPSAAVPMQDLSYVHGPTGLLCRLRNNAEAVAFHANQQINPVTDYAYDALYRLTRAQGRLHKGLGSTFATPQPGRLDLSAVETYAEQYEYDKGNNLCRLQRLGKYTRNYTIAAASNRLMAQDGTPFSYDDAGQMQDLPGKGRLAWNSGGNLARMAMVERGGAEADAEYYVYDHAGLRIRKVTRRRLADGRYATSDKRYLGAYRRHMCDAGSGQDERKVTVGGVAEHDCVAEYRKTGDSEAPRLRYQHGDHLDSVSLETNRQGAIISFEEYSPFGETTYRWQDGNLQISPKEYRYSAQEQDDSSGLYYYGFRYYAPWLGRWTSPDPAGDIDGMNLYAFVGNDPVGKKDWMGLTGNGPFKTGDRPQFPTHTKNSSFMISDQTNKTNFGGTHKLLKSDAPDKNQLNAAIPHRMSFANMRDNIFKYIYGEHLKSDFIEWTDLLLSSANAKIMQIKGSAYEKYVTDAIKEQTNKLKSTRKKIIAEVESKKVFKKNKTGFKGHHYSQQELHLGKKFMKRINGYIPNVPDIGPHKGVNLQVKERTHLHAIDSTTQIGKRSLSPTSMNIIKMKPNLLNPIAVDQSGKLIATTGEKISFQDFDKTTANLLNKFKKEVVKNCKTFSAGLSKW